MNVLQAVSRMDRSLISLNYQCFINRHLTYRTYTCFHYYSPNVYRCIYRSLNS
ncbi:hypothetical protein BRC2024_ULFKEANI_CDS_0010 [Acinetobacter phage vB_AbaM_Konradin-v2]